MNGASWRARHSCIAGRSAYCLGHIKAVGAGDKALQLGPKSYCCTPTPPSSPTSLMHPEMLLTISWYDTIRAGLLEQAVKNSNFKLFWKCFAWFSVFIQRFVIVPFFFCSFQTAVFISLLLQWSFYQQLLWSPDCQPRLLALVLTSCQVRLCWCPTEGEGCQSSAEESCCRRDCSKHMVTCTMCGKKQEFLLSAPL